MKAEIYRFFGYENSRNGNEQAARNEINARLAAIEEAIVSLWKALPDGGTVLFRVGISNLILPAGSPASDGGFLIVTKPGDTLQASVVLRAMPNPGDRL